MLLDRNDSKIGVNAGGARESAPVLRRVVGFRHLPHIAGLIGQVTANGLRPDRAENY